MYQIALGLRSLLYRKNQYASLLLVCMVGVGVSLFSIFLIRGMLFSLESKARIYYGGDYQFIGGKNNLAFDNTAEFIEQLREVFGSSAVISERFDCDAKNSALYFEGVGVRQRVIKGVNFDIEKRLFNSFNYVSGNAENIAGTNGILLSEPIAELLGASMGDEVTLMMRTASGYLNTMTLVVKGIFRDSSLFGMYTSYMDIDFLRKIFGVSPTWANRIAIDFQGKSPKAKEEYQSLLEKKFNMFRLVEDKQLFYDQLLTGRLKEATYALTPLSANMQELRVLISAMEGIASFVIITLVVIIVAGIGSTYRVLVMKRINEIGIYMAIGMKNSSIVLTILSESLFLLLAGCFSGLLFAFLLCLLSSAFNFSFIPAFDIFLQNGHLVPLFDIKATLLVCFVVIVLTVLAVLYSIQKSVRIMPVQALATTE